MKTKLLLLLTVVLFSSCMTQKKQQRIATAYMHSHPIELATLCSIHFSPQTIYKKGEVIHTSDTVVTPGITIPCPEDKDGNITHVQCPPQLTVRDTIWRTDTLEIVDKASIAVLLDQINKLSISEAVLSSEKDELKKDKRNLIFGLIGSGLGLLGMLWLKFR